MTDNDFDWLCDLVRRESAIVLEPGKEYLAESRLHPIARRQGYETVGELLQHLQRSRSADLHVDVIDAMTTNETSFFRDTHPWETLRTELIPALLERNRLSKRITVWCGASSSGQEPYTLALLLREHFAADLESWQVRIVATDLSPSMLARTAAGRYSQLEVNRGLPAPMLVRWFQRQGIEWEIDASIRAMVTTGRVNLADERTWGSVPKADLVLLRNVLIYFDVPTKQAILRAVHRRLEPGAPLFLGSSETTLGLVESFERVQSGKTIYYVPKPEGSA
jgi:chemotaxis protein methyltransferase CheR